MNDNFEYKSPSQVSVDKNEVNRKLADITKVSKLVPIAFRDTSPLYNGRSNANQTGTSRMHIQPQIECQDIVVSYANHYANGTIVANTNTINVKASIEINGAIIPIWFNGKRTITIEAGAVVISDPIGVTIKPTDSVYFRTYWDAGSGGYIPQNLSIVSMQKLAGVSDGVVYGSDLTDSGTITDASTGGTFAPRTILGIADDLEKSVLIVGDSIIDGTGDVNQNSLGNTGFVARYCYLNKIGCSKISTPGDSLNAIKSNLYLRTKIIDKHNIAISDYGTNDLPSYTVSVIKNNLLYIWKYLNRRGLKVYQTTMLPRTTSTDGFRTLANQSLTSYEDKRLEINAWLKDTSINGAIAQSQNSLYGVFDTASVVEDVSGKWKVASNPVFTGTVDSAGTNYINDADIPYALTDLDNIGILKITSGTGAGQELNINNNDYGATRIYLKTNFSTIPDNTSTYEIIEVPTGDGVHPNPQIHKLLATAITI